MEDGKRFEAFDIRLGDPDAPEVSALLEAYWGYIAERFPPAANFALDRAALKRPGVSFFVAEREGRCVGCAALASLDDAAAEVKSMYVIDSERGAGLADALLDAVEGEARRCGVEWLYLETGDVLNRAQSFYARRGFRVRGPFGGYDDHPRLVFMERRLQPLDGSGGDPIRR